MKNQPFHSWLISRSWIVLFFGLWFFETGCNQNQIDTTPNILPRSQGGQANQNEGGIMEEGGSMGGNQGEENCESCIQVGHFYRFTELALTSLDQNPMHPVIGTLNSLWAGDIENHQLNILFEIKEVAADQIRVSALNAAWNGQGDDDYCLLNDTAIEFNFTRSGCGFENSEKAGINIYAGSTEYPKNCAIVDA